MLVIAAILFFLTHLGVSATPLRGVLVKALGDGAYLAAYSLVSVTSLGFLIYAYGSASHTDFLWPPTPTAFALTKVLMAVAFLLLTLGLLTKNPTAVGQQDAVRLPLNGVFAIVRHPVQWAILLWAIAHLMSNGDIASIILCGTIALVSTLGMVAMDRKKRAQPEPEWQAFFKKTSFFPFVAIAARRNSLSFRDINWFAVAGGLAAYVGVYALHGWIAGVPLV